MCLRTAAGGNSDHLGGGQGQGPCGTWTRPRQAPVGGGCGAGNRSDSFKALKFHGSAEYLE